VTNSEPRDLNLFGPQDDEWKDDEKAGSKKSPAAKAINAKAGAKQLGSGESLIFTRKLPQFTVDSVPAKIL